MFSPKFFKTPRDSTALPFSSPLSTPIREIRGGGGILTDFGAANKLTKKALLMYQAIYLATGLFTTLAAQWLWYSGAADEHLMLSIFVAYFGMALVPHQLGREQRANVRMPWRLIFITAALDMIALICGTTGMFYIGSGVYQVIHSSIILFTALLTRLTNNSRITKLQWLSLFVIMIGLATSRLGATHGKQHPNENLGIGLSLAGVLCWAVVYALNERILGEKYRVPPRLLCQSLGMVSSCVFAIYICLYTLPNIHRLFLEPIAAQNTSLSVVVVIYVLIGVSSYAHNISYFVMMSDVGAVTTGVLSSVRAVLIFGLSSIMYCNNDATQCYTGMKAVATLLVALGVVLFSSGKSKAKALASSDDDLSAMELT